MSKLAKRCSALFIASSLGGLLSACPSDPPPNTNVRPIPSTPPGLITPTPPPGSVIQPPSPGPGLPGDPSPLPTSTPGTSTGLAIATTGLPTAVLNFNYSFGLQASGGSGSYNWSIVSGNLPRELGLDPNTGQIFGRPTQSGSFEFEVQALDNQSGQVARQRLFILVADSDAGVNTLSVLTSTLTSGVVDRGYSQRLEVTGGVAPFSWTISAGALPDGLSLNTNTGEISGTPTLRGEETFTVRVTDGQGRTQTRTLSITINRTDSDITVLTASLPPGVSGTAYNRTACGQTFSGQLSATGGDGDYRWSVSRGNLPPGLTMNSNGSITGTPTQVGSYTFTVRVDDGEENSASKVFTAEISQVLIHNFTPDSGGKGLRMTIFGEGLSSMGGGTQVRFGDVQSVPGAVNTVVDCQQFQTNIPENAKTGLITLRNGTTDLGSSSKPFVAEDVVINEVFVSPDGSGNQFVELKNRSSASVSIAGWYLHYTGEDGSLVSFPIPPETPPLATGALTVINIGRNGGTSATDIYTGTGVQEMRFDPLNGTAADALTRVALCKDNPVNPGEVCATSATDTKYRDYLQFGGAAVDGQDLENNAVSVGIWSDDATLSTTTLVAPLSAVSDDFADDNAAQFGVAEAGNDKSGLLVDDGNTKFADYTGEAVLYYTPETGTLANQQQRIRRTVTGVGTGVQEDRVRLSAPIFEAKIQATNTGDGAVGNGILVDTVEMLGAPRTTAPTYAGDLVNVVAGTVLRTVLGLQAGPRVELSEVPFSPTVAGNVSDGVNVGGFEVAAGSVDLVTGAQTVNVTYVRNPGDLSSTQNFSVVRTVSGLNSATNRIAITQALASAAVSADNEGDGLPGSEIELTATTNFATGDRALFNGLNCANAAPCELTLGGNLVRLASPLAQLQISNDNTGNGEESSRLQVTLANADRFPVDASVRINGQLRQIQQITPSFGGTEPLFQLSAPFQMTLNNGTPQGDGTSGQGIGVTSTDGFLVNNRVRLGNEVRRITAIVPGTPPRIELDNHLGNMTVATANAGNGSSAAPLTVADATGFSSGNTVRFAGLNQVRTITSVNGNNLVLSAPVYRSLQTTVAPGSPAANQINLVSVAGLTAGANGDWLHFAGDNIRQITGIAGNQVTLNAALPAIPADNSEVRVLLNGGELNRVPTIGNLTPVGVGGDGAAVPYNINLVPTAGTFTLVPYDDAGARQARISRIPTSGSIYLAPRAGFLRKYLSIKLTGDNLAVGGYTTTTAPSPRQ
ncbi:MAG: putative Ig domain-containing protein [Candidatus Sericytochromatia bacterium]|nr:putative Ig domain-containing protein [Candidatus Sericytochromatia bacterium]